MSAESLFGFDELFFSRTDKRGIVLAGNSVFQRVSKYEWEELLGKPHSLIRHPKMPRGVFHLLWETILSDRLIGAYVVNQAKDGSYYWVFALVSPLKDGFLSVRLKPSSPMFGVVQSAYEKLLAAEKSSKLSPAQSQAALLEALAQLGFPDYLTFMTDALMKELIARNDALHLPPIAVLEKLEEMLKLATELKGRAQSIYQAYQQSAFVPLNLEVQAEKIGAEGASIAVISSQYAQLAKQIKEETLRFSKSGDMVEETVRSSQFDVCYALLQREMCLAFKADKSAMPIDVPKEMELLDQMFVAGMLKTAGKLKEIDAEFQGFSFAFEEVKKLAMALEIVSLSGKIEAAKIKQSSGQLVSFLEDLGKFKSSLKMALDEINKSATLLSKKSHEMRQNLSSSKSC